MGFIRKKPLSCKGTFSPRIFLSSKSCAYKSSRSSSSSQPPLRREITIFCSSSSFLWFSAMAFSNSLSCSSVTFWRICPVWASMMSLFSTSMARDSLTRRIRPSRSAASGSRIWFRIAERRSAGESIQYVASQRIRGIAGLSWHTFSLSAKGKKLVILWAFADWNKEGYIRRRSGQLARPTFFVHPDSPHQLLEYHLVVVGVVQDGPVWSVYYVRYLVDNSRSGTFKKVSGLLAVPTSSSSASAMVIYIFQKKGQYWGAFCAGDMIPFYWAII